MIGPHSQHGPLAMNIAPLDRLISVSSGPEQYSEAIRLSDLADASYVVLLGVPGLGKTVAFEHFARAEALSSEAAFLFTPEDLIADGTYFIDAIDEVSIQEALNIAKALKRTAGVRWRVSCRAEDWNSGGKLSKAFGSECAAVDSLPVIAQLQPLDEGEAVAVLSAFGHPSPSSVLSTLQTLRSTPFVMTPLGLRFLMSVNPERLPSITRFELYEAGVTHFATEHNRSKADCEASPSPHIVLDIAGRIFLTLLMAGKHSLQRTSIGNSSTLTTLEIGLELTEIDAALDTALFMKKGEDFVPLHRSIQEFLAARFLARLVTEGIGGMRLHIERMLALIVSSDGLPSEGIKPLYAWSTCHLSNEGALTEAKRLVEREPEALLLHGDAATLPWDLRALILEGAGQRDPFFKWTADQWGPATTCTAGLITPELKDLVLSILGTEESLHRLSSVLEALSAGSPIAEAADACWQVALRKSTNLWCREEAVAAWANCANPTTEDVWARIDELGAGHDQLIDRCRIVAQLFCLLPSDQLSAADVIRVLACLRLAGDGKGVGRSIPITYALRDVAWHAAVPHLWKPLMLENPKQWRPSSGVGSVEQRFASALCTAVLASGSDITLDEFAKMMVATGSITGTESSFRSVAANWVATRVDKDDVAKALLLIGDQDITSIGSIAFGLRGVGLQPTAGLLRWMLTQEVLLERLGPVYVGRQASTWVLQQNEDAPSWLNEFLDECVDSEATYAAREHVAMHAEDLSRMHEPQTNGVEAHLVRMIPEWHIASASIENGQNTDALIWGAEVYCGNRPLPWVRKSGPEALREAFGDQLAQSMLTGLASVLLKDQEWEWIQLARVASAAILLESQPAALSTVSVERILEIFFATEPLRDGVRKERIENYCIERLNQSVHDEASPLKLLADKRATDWTLLLIKLGARLSQSALHAWAARTAMKHPEDLSGLSLDSALKAAGLNLQEQELIPIINQMLRRPEQEVTNSALTSATIEQADRLRWAYFAVCLRPDMYGADFTRCLMRTDDPTIHRLIVDGYPRHAYTLNTASMLHVGNLLLQFMFQRDPRMTGHYERFWPDTMKVLRSTSSSDEARVEAVLLELLEHAKDTRWVETIKHELELYRRDIRAETQKLVSPSELAKVLAGKGPVDAQDLRALVIIVLEEIATEMQPSPYNPWRLYWDNRSPKLENDCRDVLADKLRDKLRYFGSFEVYPEAASSGRTRADMLVTYGEFAVPIEAKRTSHDHLWYGHSGQLQTYSLAKNTEAQGIYLVFWFGKALSLTAPPTGTKPTTPKALRDALERMLSPELLGTTSVIVLDVSDAAAAAKDRKGCELAKAKAAKTKRKPTSNSTG